MGIHKPRRIEIWLSADNKNYEKVGEKSFTQDEIFCEGTFVEDISIPVAGKRARYVRVTSKGPGKCPALHVRFGQDARTFFDELIVE